MAHRASCLFLLLLPGSLAHALTLNPTTFVQATNTAMSELVALVGLGADLHAYEGAIPYSTKYGADFGPTITAIMIPGTATKALTDLGVPNIPGFVPLPKINIQKAINRRLFIGTEFIPTIKTKGYSFSIWGADIQYTLISRPRLPPIAIRAQYNDANLAFVRTRTVGGDVVVTYDLLILDLYGGGGYRHVSGDVSNPTGTIPQDSGLRYSHTLDAGHFFVGATVKAGFVRITTEANITTRNVTTYGAKLSFFF